MIGSAKESGSVAESSGSASLSGVGSSSVGSGSSSCQCDFEVTDITLTSGTDGSYTITNTGCGEIAISGHAQEDGAIPSSYIIGDTILSEGESTTVLIEFEVDIRLTDFRVTTPTCGDREYTWPTFP
jgi:hypothetical protein